MGFDIIAKVDFLIDKYSSKKRQLISILQDVQAECNYLPRNALERIAEKLEQPLIDIFSMATFYESFSLEPRGEHLITVCLGTACHVRGGLRVLDEIQRKLGVKDGETTADNKFTLKTVNCLGCCAIGPIIVVDGEYYGQMTAQKIGSVLDKHRS